MPSKRPASSRTPGAAASSRAASWVNGSPRGVSTMPGKIGSAAPCRIDGGSNDVGAQHHARPAAGRGIVHRPVPADAEVAQRHRFQRP